MSEVEVRKEQRVLEGAAEAFMRYGYARTTMADIAVNAGMSRPAIYLLFPDKEAIFRSVVGEMDRRKLAEIRRTVECIADRGEKLKAACLEWGLHPAEVAQAHPDAADLFNLRFPAVRAAYLNFQTFVAELIAPVAAASSLEASPDDLARTLVFGMRGLRDGASDIHDLRRMIAIHVDVLVQALQAAITKPPAASARK